MNAHLLLLFVVINSHRASEKDYLNDRLLPHVTMVHLNGQIVSRVVESIITRCPNLEILHIPKRLRRAFEHSTVGKSLVNAPFSIEFDDGTNESSTIRRRLCEELGIKTLPKGLPHIHWQFFRELRTAFNRGKFDIFSGRTFNQGELLKRRYGIPEGPYKSLTAFGKEQTPPISAPAVYQMEDRALEKLDIQKH